MRQILRLAGAVALAAAFAAPAAYAAGGHPGGGHRGGGHMGGGRPPVVHAMPHIPKAPSFHAPAHRPVPHVNRVPHVQGPVVHHNGGGNWQGGGHRGHHGHHRHHGRFLVYAAPLYDYDNSYYSNGECGWMWRRYLNTGSLRWKHRYYQCIE
jgi:hypothetical protein